MVAPLTMMLRIGRESDVLSSDPTVVAETDLYEVNQGDEVQMRVYIKSFIFGQGQASVYWSATACAGSLVVAAGQINFDYANKESLDQTITLVTQADIANPGLRTVEITFSNPVGCVIEPASNPLTFDVLNQSGPPIVSVTPERAAITEGETARFKVERDRTNQDCTLAWVASAPAGDIDGQTSGQVGLNNNTRSKFVSIATVDRSGTQGARDLNFALSVIVGCQLRPGGDRAKTVINDKTNINQWWNSGTRRSGLLWNSGVSYWGTADKLRNFESQVHLLDVICGGNFGGSDAFIQTWDLLAGGPPSTSPAITAKSQFDWRSAKGNFTAGFNFCPSGTWLVFVIDTIPHSHASATHPTIWQQVGNGDYDAYYKAMGERARANMLAKGHPIDRLVLRPNHEFNQSNHYQVFSGPVNNGPNGQVLPNMIDQRAHYREAMKRFASKFREGYGYDLKIIFSPARDFMGTGEDLGDWVNFYAEEYTNHLSQTRDVYDAIDTSWHPAVKPSNLTEFNKWMNGDLDSTSYGFLTNQVAWALSHGLPISHVEWSPRYEASRRNPIPHLIYQWTWDHFTAYKHMFAFDCVFHSNTLVSSTTLGENWPAGVAKYKELWSGIKSS